MSKETKVGKIIEDAALLGHRDAFHVAAIVVNGLSGVGANDPVRFVKGRLDQVFICHISEREAIVDPFLIGRANQGEMFWVLPLPELVSKLSHTFSLEGHPEDAKAAIEEESFRSNRDDDDCDWSQC